MKKGWEKTWRGLGVIQSSPRVFLEHPENIQLIHTNSMPKFKPAFCRKRWIQRQKRRHWVLSSLIKIHLRSGCSLGLFNYVIQYISIYLASLGFLLLALERPLINVRKGRREKKMQPKQKAQTCPDLPGVTIHLPGIVSLEFLSHLSFSNE